MAGLEDIFGDPENMPPDLKASLSKLAEKVIAEIVPDVKLRGLLVGIGKMAGRNQQALKGLIEQMANLCQLGKQEAEKTHALEENARHQEALIAALAKRIGTLEGGTDGS